MFMAGTENIPINNKAVLNILQTIRAVMSSATEAELGALFINAKMAVSMQRTLKEMGHPQTCTPICSNNSTAHIQNHAQGFEGHGHAIPLVALP
jgi:hypothetical protein